MIALTFALPDESRAFVAGLENRVALGTGDGLLPVVLGRCAGQEVVVIHTGVGEVPVYRARLAQFLAVGQQGVKPRLLISSGYAGGLQAGKEVGHLILGANVSQPELLAKTRGLLAARIVHTGTLTTHSAAVETVSAKQALGAETGAIAVDMETAWIAAVCAGAEVPMLSLRVISDAVDQDFPVPGGVFFDARRQRPRYFFLPSWLAAHPRRIGPFVRFVKGLGPARAGLTEALRTIVAKI